ncbi:phosphoribosylglycinamide formyltransferase [Bacillaceae bacterium SIJ1]|uniref:phosphoribosylglycinamide formyltransferase n=1 Tax=Litoribacterium kuwaitense TaxID=1398745 RepID=UPI0013EC68A3|nr:phosphoribosylglycinamide formyltransferase [Litoribacterium kuwaitense]NGP46074.1 phosphoribosylglycinamide formyltransferase [Litoribacterium kuwaitense]
MGRIAVFASGAGSNFDAIERAIANGTLEAELVLVVCDRPSAEVIKKAEHAGIDVFQFAPKSYPDKQAFEKDIVQQLEQRHVDLVVLAGYMRLIGSTLLESYEGKIINIHPSLLPAFPGKDAIGQAIDAGVKVSGVTVHYVDEGMDTGPIIAQEAIVIQDTDSYDEVKKRIQSVEHTLYPQVISHVLKGALST